MTHDICRDTMDSGISLFCSWSNQRHPLHTQHDSHYLDSQVCLYVCMQTCTHMNIYIHRHICLYTYIRILSEKHICIYTYLCRHICMQAWTHMNIYVYLRRYVYIHECFPLVIRMYVYIHTCLYIYMYVCIYACGRMGVCGCVLVWVGVSVGGWVGGCVRACMCMCVTQFMWRRERGEGRKVTSVRECVFH